MDKAVAQESLVNILRDGQNCGMGVFTEHGRVVTVCHCVKDAFKTTERIVRVSKFTDPTVVVDMTVEWYDQEFAFDVAILKPLLPKSEAFSEFQRRLTVARMQSPVSEPHNDVDVHMFRREPQGWVSGKTQLLPNREMAEIENNPKIEVHKGTSGSPVFSDSGEVIGLAMLSADDADNFQGIISTENSRNPVFTLLGPSITFLKSRSFRGSQRHLFDLIVSPHFEETVNNLLLGTGAVLADPDCRCPHRFDLTEAQLEDYLINHPHPSGFVLDTEWWFPYQTNRNRRPVWDLVCHILVNGKPGLLLVEAKAHVGELSQQNSKRPPSDSARSRANDYSIRLRLAEASLSYSDLGLGRFRLSHERHYQLSNRLAYLDKLAQEGVPTVLMYLGCLNSPDWPHDPLQDEGHWKDVVVEHMTAVAPTTFLEQVFPTAKGGSMQMIVRGTPA